MEEIIDKLYFVQIKNFLPVKDNIKRRRQGTDWEKIFAENTYDQGLLSKVDK